MNNFTNSIKRFFKNKNTVTIIGVVAIIAILYFGYTFQINRAINPIKGIPVASDDIQPRTLITSEMVSVIEVAPIMLEKSNVIRSKAAVVGKYSNYHTMIPKGSMFYTGTVVSEDKLPDYAFVQVKKGQVVYSFPVNMNSTYGNSIFPGNKIDMWMKANDDDGKVMLGRLLENVEILQVKDSQGRHVFETTAESRTPAFLVFGLKEDLYVLLKKASYLGSYGVELFPVPHGGVVDLEGDTQVSTQYLKDFINAKTVMIEESNNTEDETNETTGEE